jgi:hypothetical protein
MTGVITIIAAAAGSVARPASSGLSPNAAGSWKYRMSTYISAFTVPATMGIARVAPTSTRLRSSCRSTRGAVTRFSAQTKPAAPRMATTNVAPAAPCSIRPATTPAPAPESAISTDEATNSTRPPRNTRRRPKTSPSAPEVTITAAPTSE